jgi:hypothetical protein
MTRRQWTESADRRTLYAPAAPPLFVERLEGLDGRTLRPARRGRKPGTAAQPESKDEENDKGQSDFSGF